MSAEQITALINLGAAAAVIIVVVYFLKFIEKRDAKYQERDQQWQSFFQMLIENKDAPLIKLTQVIGSLLTEFRNHDTWEHTKLDEMSQAVRDRKTQPRKQP